MSETTQEFRPLINPDSKFQPVKQIFNGFEIEKRALLFTLEKDHTKASNGLKIYDEVLRDGCQIDQGYIKDIQLAIKVLNELGINLNDFKPNTVRIRRFGPNHRATKVSKYPYVLTLKDRKETKKREAEFKLSVHQFKQYWPMTEGARVQKKRLRKTIKGWDFELDAFLDRVLLIAECEVDDEEKLDRVPKMGLDITSDKNFTNKSLAK